MREGQILVTIIDKLFIPKIVDKEIEPAIAIHLPYMNGSRLADFVIIEDTNIHAYEIKGQFDNLSKLSEQLSSYANCFDFVNIVVDKKHFAKSMEKIPDFIGVYLIEDKDISLIRKPKKNKSITKHGILSFLNKNELLSLNFKQDGSNKLTKEEIRNQIIEQNTIKKIKSTTLEYMRQSHSIYFKDFLTERGSFTIEDDLTLLSRRRRS